MAADRRRLRARLRKLERDTPPRRDYERALHTIEEAARRSADLRAARERAVPRITYPADLPVTQAREDIKAAIERAQVVVLCGETGSGKTTQLPKICLELGRGVAGLIGHTQPRRIAARTVAARIAEELDTPLGDAVGCKVRFADQTGGLTLVKLMTDGILLAETQGDRLLDRYDTIIVDEAHERSLNIDFLLGYLKTILPKRPDLKLIITSATIDPERFANHFADPVTGEPAPIILVSGRMYPVETRYKPLLQHIDDDVLAKTNTEQREPGDIIGGVIDAVAEIEREYPSAQGGDILVFMPGEREIRETAHALRRRSERDPLSRVQILPLYARLSIEEQRRAFAPHPGRRIVIATNVAETSLTVPGIRYVIDPGLARISRYSARSKIQGLPVEPISRASANQRQGRCGRVGPGVCIRLYSEEDFETREEFTQPEILRTNLASVVLQMAALNLGKPDEFPFVEPPDPRLIRDGYDTLQELGAVDEQNRLTPIGREMARLPIDPRIARMILAARQENCLNEVLPIAAALSVQDPRDRPADRQEAADRAHERFAHEHSDFLGYLKLWHFYHDSIRPLSRSKRAKACEQNFLSERRLREWEEVVRQLRDMLGELENEASRRTRGEPILTRAADKPADEDAIHRALLTGLLTTIGHRKDSPFEYSGCRGAKFSIHPASALFDSKPKWLVAAELVRTTKLYARCVARIDPMWVERLGEHLLTRTYSEPAWDPVLARVNAFEKVSLAGLEIVPKRRVHYGPIDPAKARELFIFHALVHGEWDTSIPALLHNREIEASVRRMENKLRRLDLMSEEKARFDFYDKRLPPDVYTGQGFEHWLRRAERADPGLLRMEEDDLLAEETALDAAAAFPDAVKIGPSEVLAKYRFDPGAAHDGVTLEVPVAVLASLSQNAADRAVPGLMVERIEALLRTLPKAIRRQIDHRKMAQEIAPDALRLEGSLLDVVGRLVGAKVGVAVTADMFRPDDLPPHLFPRVRVTGDGGDELAVSRDVEGLRRDLRDRIEAGVRKAAATGLERDGLKDWDFDELPATVTLDVGATRITGYPALVNQGKVAGVRVFADEHSARDAMREGLARLLVPRLVKDLRYREQAVVQFNEMATRYAALRTGDDFRDQFRMLIADRAFVGDGDPAAIRTARAFEAAIDDGWQRLTATVHEVSGVLGPTLADAIALRSRVEGEVPPAWAVAAKDVRAQLAALLTPGFLIRTPWRWLRCYPRYLRAATLRLERLRGGGEGKDLAKQREVVAWARRYGERAAVLAAKGTTSPALDELRWLIEEYRVSLFAQELRTSVPVSPKRLESQILLIGA